MDMKTYLKQATPEERQALASEVDSSVAYFYQIAGDHKKPGPKLCKKLVKAEPRLTLAELRPEIWASEPVTRRATKLKATKGRATK